MNISYSYGIMDLFHYGHLKALQKAAKDADLHVVGLVSDKSAKAWLGNIVSSEEERRAVLENISCVDWVMPQDKLDPTENLKKLHYIYPEATITLFRGDDITSAAAREYLKSIGGKVESLDYYAKLSPMEILNALNSRIEQTERHPGLISTKASTLQALQARLTKSTIESLMIVKVGDVRTKPEDVTNEIGQSFKGKKIVIRSSSKGEDGFESSNAGHYESILGVNADNPEEVLAALKEVYHSYGKDGEIGNEEQILVQSQTFDVQYSGVCFTRDIQRNRPYYVVNYDDTGSTDKVTSGGGGSTIWIAQDADENSVPEQWRSLFQAIHELESILTGMLLDIEFAVKKDGSVVIFQVRPLAASYKFGRNASVQKLIDRKNAIRAKYNRYIERTGNHILSDMAFWNPAEIIGDNPHHLDYSLYRDIITHRAWNDGLVPMGYRKVSSDLMHQLGNKPYISVENSFMSLIPVSLRDDLSYKLCDFYCKKLRKDWSAHDKIEFEIVYSCFDFQTDSRIQELKENGFSDEEIKEIRDSLFKQTENLILHYPEVLKEDAQSINKLEEIRKDVLSKLPDANKVYKLSDLITILLDAIKQYGTPQFSRQARYAFVAKSMGSTLRSQGYWSAQDYDSFMATVETVATQFERDFSRYMKGEYSKEAFNEKYGHLRAGTYDIRTPRYDKMDFGGAAASSTSSKAETPVINTLPESCLTGADKAIKDVAFVFDANHLLQYMKTSLEQREFFKFIFTKSLSQVIELVAQVGEILGMTRGAMSYFDINEIQSFSLYNEKEHMREYMAELLPLRKESFRECSQVILPNVVSQTCDLDFIQTINSRPNFITEKTVEGETVALDIVDTKDIEGKIVVIEKADPGYDWIFAKKIAGLVTKYGGVASHMAIRCAEFEIPAAIGCGDKIFSYAVEHSKLYMDCKNGIIK